MNHHFPQMSHPAQKKLVVGLLLVAAIPLLMACGQAGTTLQPTAAPAPTAIAPTEEAAASETELTRVENGDGPPFYARFGENETFGNSEWVAIVFYRDPNCVPDEFNLNQFFDFPGETGPGAFGCQPPTTDVVEYWAGEPGSGPHRRYRR